jgi:hypothetical protein
VQVLVVAMAILMVQKEVQEQVLLCLDQVFQQFQRLVAVAVVVLKQEIQAFRADQAAVAAGIEARAQELLDKAIQVQAAIAAVALAAAEPVALVSIEAAAEPDVYGHTPVQPMLVAAAKPVKPEQTEQVVVATLAGSRLLTHLQRVVDQVW